MNYTENHHLPQWEKSDRVLMDDFNQAMSRIETELNNAGNEAAEAAAKANAAQTTANSAQTTANRAYNPSYKPYATGTYVGNGGTTQISLGFQPSFAIVTGQGLFSITAAASYALPEVAVAGPNGNMSPAIEFTASGMTITHVQGRFPMINSSNATYSYIAFR